MRRRLRLNATGEARGPADDRVRGCHVVEDGGVSHRVSLYELLRARHVPLRQVVALGLGVDDLGAPVGAAARRAGLSPDRLASRISAEGSTSASFAGRETFAG